MNASTATSVASPQTITNLNQFTTAVSAVTTKTNPQFGANINISINNGSTNSMPASTTTSKIILTNEKHQNQQPQQTQSRFLTSGNYRVFIYRLN